MTAEQALDAYVELERSVGDERAAEWRACAAFIRADDGTARGRADAARGERTFLTYVKSGLATATLVPGIDDCQPQTLVRHRRYPRISGCGEVVGRDRGLDCACAAAEQAYMAGYNRAILAADPAARRLNCEASS